MKKVLFLSAWAAMMLGAVSCSNDMEPELTNGTVQFKVELPGAIDSRAIISDGTTATKLDVACYDADGNKLAVEPTVKTDFVNREATVTYKLVKGQKYQFAFFAHADGAPYTFNAGSKLSDCNFTVDYTTENKVNCNDEKRDAFFGVLEDYEVTAEVTEVKLHRPFAQLNFGTDDLTAAQTVGFDPNQSQVVVSKVGTTFNLSTGKTSGEKENVTFALAALPANPATLTVGGTAYAWMAMNYFLAPADDAIIEATMTAKKDSKTAVVPVSNVPVKKNHRTNIIGSLFTEDANIKVIIEPAFEEPDNNVNYPQADKWDGSVADPVVDGDNVTINSAAQLAGLVANARNYNGKTITLTKDIDLDNRDWSPIGAQDMGAYPGTALIGVKFDGGNHTIYNLKCNATGKYATAGLIGSVTGTCEFKNLTINGANVTSEHFAGAIVAYMAEGTLTIDNCHVINATVTSTPCLYANGNYDDGNQAGGIAGNVGNAVVTNCSAEGSTIKAYRDCGGIAGFLNIASNAQFAGNSVKNCTIIADQSVNNTGYGPKTFNARPLVGRYNNMGADETTNTISKVIVKTISITGEETTTNY